MAGKTFKIGAGISLDGEKEYKQAVSEISQANRVLASEMQKVTAEFQDNGKSVKDLTAKQDVLERQLLNQTDKVDMLRKALQNAAREYGEADKHTKDWQISLNKAEAELAQTRKELDKTTKELNDFGNEAKEATKQGSLLGDIFKGGFFSNIASDALNAVVGTIKQFAAEAFSFSDELSRMSAETGRSVEELQKLKYIGDDVGITLDTITSVQSKLTKSMSEAQKGSSALSMEFSALGVRYIESDGSLRNVTDVMYDTLDALGKMTNETERDAAAMQLFGKSATDLNPLIKAGSDELKRLGEEAKNTGAVMSEDAVRGLDILGDSFDHIKQQTTALVGELISSLIPSFQSVEDVNNELARNTEITALIDRYTSLKNRLNDNTLSSDELRAVSEELATVKEKLIDLSDGMIDSYAEENGTLDDQIEKYSQLNEEEKKLLEAQLINKAAGYDDLLQKRDELLRKNTSATSELTAAQILYTQEQTKLNQMLRDGAAPEAIGAQELKIESLKIAIEGIPGVMSGLKDMAGKIETELDKTSDAVDEASDAMQGLFEIGWSARDLSDEFGVSLGDVYNVLNNVAAGAENAAKQVNAFADAASRANLPGYSGGSGGRNGGNYQGTGYQGGGNGAAPFYVNIQPGNISLDGRTIGQVSYDYSIDYSDLRGANQIR